MKLLSLAGITLATLSLLASCAKNDGASAGLPLVTPPVKAAAPKGMQSGRALDPADLRSRFFTEGPTSIFRILTSIDDRITSINTRTTESAHTCLTAEPVAYTITAWGQTVQMYAQCHEVLGTPTATDPKLIQFGRKDGVLYLYVANGAERVAAIVSPIVGVTDRYDVKAWIGVGYTNSGCGAGAWDTCSYGVVQLHADSSAMGFEMAVAGIGFGYCGAQLKADATNVYVTGSTDMGTTCNAIDTACVSAASTATAGTCAAPLTTFDIPAMGRKAAVGSGAAIAPTWGVSQYPVAPNVTLNGTATDDLNFGPTTATTGVAAF